MNTRLVPTNTTVVKESVKFSIMPVFLVKKTNNRRMPFEDSIIKSVLIK